MPKSQRHVAEVIFRVGSNCHRYLLVINGRFRSLVTHEKDFLLQLAALFGQLNQIGGLKQRAVQSMRALTALVLSAILSCPMAFALPAGWEVILGDVSFETNGSVLNVTSTSQQAIVQYQSFNVGLGETVNFWLPSSTASILNRVIGGEASVIAGTISSNGQVLLVNPSGINIAATAQINVGALVASSLGLSDQNYLSGNWVFSRQGSPAAVVNQGEITTAEGGYAALIGSTVQNGGNITAPLGEVALAVGDQVSVNISPHLELTVTVDEALQAKVAAYQDAIRHSGEISAQTIALQAEVGEQLFASVVNVDGLIRASSATRDKTGKIVLEAGSKNHDALVRNSGVLDASGTDGQPDGGTIRMAGDVVEQAGQVLAEGAEGGTGGYIEITSTNGTVLEAGSVTSARGAGENSSAGTIIVWSDTDTDFQHTALLDVSGGSASGDGGLVEVSARDTVFFNGHARGEAVNGVSGEILIDPTVIRIRAAGHNGSSSTPYNDPDLDGSQSIFLNTSFSGFANVTLEATDDIYIEAPWDLSGITAGNSLILRAGDDIFIENTVTTNGGNIQLFANHDFTGVGGPAASGDGDIVFNSNGQLVSNGGNILLNANKVTLDSNNVIDAGAGNISITTTSTSQTGSADNSLLNGTLTANHLDMVIGGRIDLGADYQFNVNTHALDVNSLYINKDMTDTEWNGLNFTNLNFLRLNANRTLTATSDFVFQANDYVYIYGTIDTQGHNLTIRNNLTDNNIGTTLVGGTGQLLSGGGDITLEGFRYNLQNGSLLDAGAGNVNLSTTATNSTSGAHTSVLGGTITANHLEITSPGRVDINENYQFNVNSHSLSLGSVYINKDMTDTEWNALSINNLDRLRITNGRTFSSNGDLTLTVGNHFDVLGTIDTQGNNLSLLADANGSTGQVVIYGTGVLQSGGGDILLQGYRFDLQDGGVINAGAGNVSMIATSTSTTSTSQRSFINGEINANHLDVQVAGRLDLRPDYQLNVSSNAFDVNSLYITRDMSDA